MIMMMRRKVETNCKAKLNDSCFAVTVTDSVLLAALFVVEFVTTDVFSVM